MTPQVQSALDGLRERADELTIPADDAEWWLGQARPSAFLDPDADEPVVGRIGGSTVMLPPGLPDPAGDLVATIDLAALPAGVTDLPLPSDGTLLLFASLEAIAYGGHDEGYTDPIGCAVHVAAGTPVERRRLRRLNDWPGEIADSIVKIGDLHLWQGVSLPTAYHVSPRIHTADAPARYANDVPEPWRELINTHPRGAHLQLGGYGWGHQNVEPVRDAAHTAPQPTDPDNRVLLAQWNTTGEPNFHDRHVYWTIDHDDLAAGHLDRTRVTTTWNA
ncbi:DUF1963 domain-containing protein [Micromonospora cremea]|uniref:DUF1963 domain-containing protein n=1 Tax=Micromonospora cremea TaxID=709881 RepID=A0A1N6BEE3_9ACTN|nr:DUF1963 domain-containing protein [Micromonospora cremea]SIN44555.1 protein of unknown function [Micromonospora cremea]